MQWDKKFLWLDVSTHCNRTTKSTVADHSIPSKCSPGRYILFNINNFDRYSTVSTTTSKQDRKQSYGSQPKVKFMERGRREKRVSYVSIYVYQSILGWSCLQHHLRAGFRQRCFFLAYATPAFGRVAAYELSSLALTMNGDKAC